MTAPRPTPPDRPSRPDQQSDPRPDQLSDLLAGLDRSSVERLTPEESAARALDRPPAGRGGRSPKPVRRPDRRSAPDRRSGRDFGPSPRQYNRHR